MTKISIRVDHISKKQQGKELESFLTFYICWLEDWFRDYKPIKKFEILPQKESSIKSFIIVENVKLEVDLKISRWLVRGLIKK